VHHTEGHLGRDAEPEDQQHQRIKHRLGERIGFSTCCLRMLIW
jgi:hypothetical protein